MKSKENNKIEKKYIEAYKQINQIKNILWDQRYTDEECFEKIVEIVGLKSKKGRSDD
ncbi:hypothetical protein [uncultured Eubacterium sp.]|uniref:hypothetical protein n=1 Tax=uncultured Eubacterium sp. TaxID=165185 RepID=UPI0025924311|nr:hypothetical protein [uncultured Eubacterium sp.]